MLDSLEEMRDREDYKNITKVMTIEFINRKGTAYAKPSLQEVHVS